MLSHLLSLLGVVSSALAISHSHSPTVTPSVSPSVVPLVACTQDSVPEIVLGSLLGASLTGMVFTVIIRRNLHYCNRIFGQTDDSERVYDTPCPYCGKKQPADCMQEHLSACAGHLKHWAPKLASQRHILNV